MTPRRITPWWRPRTLSRQLTYGVSALVTLVVLIVGGLSLYTVRGYVAAVSDVEAKQSLSALRHSYTGTAGHDLGDVTGQSAGTIVAALSGGVLVQAILVDENGAQSAPAAARSALASMNWNVGGPQTVDMGALGSHRALSDDLGGGVRLISAISLRSANQAIAKKTAAVVVITIAAALVAAAGTVLVVREALRPLRRVAATAARAATLPLTDEDHRITTRVRRADTDPDSEVGIVGETLNKLLANVDSALAARAESDRRMRRFLTDASHELRTPLAVIQGYAELTRQDGASLPDTTEYALARIESESHRMSALVNDMLLLSRLDEGQDLDVERVDLCALVADAVNDVAVTAPDHHFVAELPEDAVWVMGDPARLHQVVGNVLTNARNHTPAGVVVTCALKAPTVAGGEVEITIVDDGPGIDAALLPDLFGRFVRADKARCREENGTGLGLAIVASITKAHGGSVTVESRPGRTEFRVRLPAAP